MKTQNTWPTHKGRARGKKARHRAMVRAQRVAAQATTPVSKRTGVIDSKGPDGAAR